MSTFVLTVFESSMEQALAAIAAAPPFVPAIEIRIDALAEPASLPALRRATEKQLILTRRGTSLSAPEVQQAIEAGFDWIDVELSDSISELSRFADSLILSHHDFHGCPDPNALYRKMKQIPAAKRKIALSPRSFADNEHILTTLASTSDPNLTMIGMGPRGLYSRILAPLFGSEMIFIAWGEKSIAAPGQLTLSQARAIYGELPTAAVPATLFAVIGNPVSHSRSPEIHNPRFREAGVSAAYSMIEVDSFEEVASAMSEETAFAPKGLSITAPFKEDGYRFAISVKAQMTERARRCGAVNTLVRLPDAFHADNTDVVGFAAGLSRAAGRSAALIGAGGAARAALVALKDADPGRQDAQTPRRPEDHSGRPGVRASGRHGIRTVIFNRTYEKAVTLARQFGAEARPLPELENFAADVIVNALPADASVKIPFQREGLYIDVSYGPGAEERSRRARDSGMTVFDGLDFLHAQAEPQSELFIRAATNGQGSARRRRQA